MVVSISDSPDPVPGASPFSYKITVKNDGPVKSLDVIVTMTLPPGVQFVSCKTSLDTKKDRRCAGETAGQVIATFPFLKAHQIIGITLTVTSPDVNAVTGLRLTAKAEGESAQKGSDAERTNVIPPWATATFLPSGRTGILQCGATLNGSTFQSDTIVQLNGSLGCKLGTPFGLKVAHSNVTLDLQGKKVMMGKPATGTVGILIGANATNIVVNGGGVNGSNGVELFDWCLKDEGGNDGLIAKNLRCYKARSAAIKVVSYNVEISTTKIDSTVPTDTTTQELPGGVGIHASGDNIRIKDTIVRRSKLIGIWADGSHADLTGYAVVIDGNTSTSRIESSPGLGVLLQSGPHFLKDTAIYGDGPAEGTSTDGVVIDTGVGHRLDGVVVKKFKNNGVMVYASGARIERCSVEEVAGDGFVISPLATNVLLNNNSSAKVFGNGFVIEGGNNTLTTNQAERNEGNGFHLIGSRNRLSNSSAQMNVGVGFIISGFGNEIRTNTGEKNVGVEWEIGADNIDQSGNAANGHRIVFGREGGSFE
jgi:uncharacterized repeat protein (TIGR01451 family)